MRPFFDSTYPRSGSRGAFAPPPSDTINARVLAAGTADVRAVPDGARYVSFAGTAEFFVRFGNSGVTAAVPSATVTDGTAAELNPAIRRIPDDATHIAVVSASAAIVTLSFYGE